MLCKYLYTHNIPLKNLSFVSNLKTDSILRKRLFVPFPEFFFVQREIKFQYFQCYVIFYIYIYIINLLFSTQRWISRTKIVKTIFQHFLRQAHNLTPTTDKLELVKVCYKFRTYFRRANKLQESCTFRPLEYVGHVRDDSFALIERWENSEVWKKHTKLVSLRNFVDWMGALLGVESTIILRSEIIR